MNLFYTAKALNYKMVKTTNTRKMFLSNKASARAPGNPERQYMKTCSRSYDCFGGGGGGSIREQTSACIVNKTSFLKTV